MNIKIMIYLGRPGLQRSLLVTMTLVNTLFCASGDDNADHNYEDNEDYVV